MLSPKDGHLLGAVFGIGAFIKLSEADQEAVKRAVEAIQSGSASSEDVAQAITLLTTVLGDAARQPTPAEHLQAAATSAWSGMQNWWNSVAAEYEPVVRQNGQKIKTAAEEGAAAVAIGATQVADRASVLLSQSSEAARQAGNRVSALLSQGPTRLSNAWAAMLADPAPAPVTRKKKAAMKAPMPRNKPRKKAPKNAARKKTSAK